VFVFVILTAVSQSTCFAISYTGSLDRLLSSIRLSEVSAKYCRKSAVLYTILGWIFYSTNVAFLLYTTMFAGCFLDFNMAPFTTYIELSPDEMLAGRILTYLFDIYLMSAWVFPHVISFMLATIFTHQYKELGRSFEEHLAESEDGHVTDADVELFRQRHQEISVGVKSADDIIMFHNAAAFCVQLFLTIIIFYSLLFFRSTTDPIILVMRVCWLMGDLIGLALTSTGGIMINHYVSTYNVCCICILHLSSVGYNLFKTKFMSCFKLHDFII